MVDHKRRRITQACDFCHGRGLRCKHGPQKQLSTDTVQHPSCLTCIEYDQECTRSRQPKKRGTKPRSAATAHGPRNVDSSSEVQSLSSITVGSRRIITALLDVYLDSVHPAFPLFCERELWVGWRDGSFPKDSSEHTSLMCMCALSAQHISKPALFTQDIDAAMSDQLQEEYLVKATQLVPTGFETCDLNLIRSYGLLALLGSQTGNNAMLHKYLALYQGICAYSNLHDEVRWSSNLTTCEREVRRRLWWAMYRLEVHTACVLGTPVRTSETQCNVGYPTGTHHPPFIPGRNGDFEDWFTGWNTTTDLYRVLEHVLSEFRVRKKPRQSILGPRDSFQSDVIMKRLARLQDDLLPQFGTASSRSDDNGRNRCGFQASNILCTIHLARLLCYISSGDNIQQACQTAHKMVESMSSIPPEYVRAMGSSLIQQLAGVGHILISVASKQHPSQVAHISIKDAVLAIIALLDHLNQQSVAASTIQQRLAEQLAEVDHPHETIEQGPEGNSEFDDWTSYLNMHIMETDAMTDCFPTQLLKGSIWPYSD